MATSNDLEDLVTLLSGPVGSTLSQVGAVLVRKLRDRGQTLKELTDQELAELVHSAAVETAETLHPGPEGEALCQRLSDIFASHALDLQATARTSAAIQ